MVEKIWPALKSCKHQCYEANDRLSPLPDDLLFFIMSFLTMKEAARTSVLSHKWNYLWRCFPVLIFEDLSTLEKMFIDDECVTQERLSFLKRVDRVMEAHLGRHVDELRVAFDLNKRCQSYLDKWLDFASEKQVKMLELNLSSCVPAAFKSSLPKCYMSHHISILKSCLCTLSLIHVNVSTKDINCLVRSCTVLENLCICLSRLLKYIRVVDLPLKLKHLEISFCPHLKSIDILAPKLVSFKHHGNPIELQIRNASSLSKLVLGHQLCTTDIVSYAFDPLSKYFPQLEYLSWEMRLSHKGSQLYNCVQFNLGINNPPVMTNLKHLELNVRALCDQSLLGWVHLIEASPLLERLVLKYFESGGRVRREILKRNGRPIKSLKTLELCNDVGLPIDLEFATYVVENSVMLKDVIVKLRPLSDPLSILITMEDQVANIKKIIPQGVRLTLTIVDIDSEA